MSKFEQFPLTAGSDDSRVQLGRRAFFLGAGAALAGCATGASGLLTNRSTKGFHPDICIAGQPNCGHGTPPGYQYSINASSISNITGTSQYNTIASIQNTAIDANRSTILSGTSSFAVSGSSINGSLNHSVPGVGSINSAFSFPQTVTPGIPFTITDANGLVHTITPSSAIASVTDTFIYNGVSVTFTYTTTDGVIFDVTYSTTSGGSGSWSVSTSNSAVACTNPIHNNGKLATGRTFVNGEQIAYEPSILSDGVEIAQRICCACLLRAAAAALAAGVFFGVAAAVIASPVGIAIAGGAVLGGGLAGGVGAIATATSVVFAGASGALGLKMVGNC